MDHLLTRIDRRVARWCRALPIIATVSMTGCASSLVCGNYSTLETAPFQPQAQNQTMSFFSKDSVTPPARTTGPQPTPTPSPPPPTKKPRTPTKSGSGATGAITPPRAFRLG